MISLTATLPDQDRVALASAERLARALAQRTRWTIPSDVELRLSRPRFFSQRHGRTRLGRRPRGPAHPFAARRDAARPGALNPRCRTDWCTSDGFSGQPRFRFGFAKEWPVILKKREEQASPVFRPTRIFAKPATRRSPGARMRMQRRWSRISFGATENPPFSIGRARRPGRRHES